MENWLTAMVHFLILAFTFTDKGGGWVTIKDWLNVLFGRKPTQNEAMFIGSLATEVFFKELALQASINLIANALAKGEFLTFEGGKQVRSENYYLLNVEPNQNESANKFWRDVVAKAIHENECLVVQHNLEFYVADSFTVDNYAFYENVYKDIVIGDLQLDRTFRESEVFRFELHDQRIKTVIDGLYSSYAKLIATSQSNYKRNNSVRGTLNLDTSYPQTEQANKDLKDLLENRFKKFFDAEGPAIVPLAKGMKFEELASNIGVKSGADGREIRNFIDDIFDFVAIALQIPPQLLKGNVADTDKAVNNFLTFCINPWAKMIETEINRKLYGKKAYLGRTYCKLDTTRIKAVDIKDVANALDVLTRIGAYCVDDSLITLGMEPLNTEWSQTRWMTKNYTPITEAAKGGG